MTRGPRRAGWLLAAALAAIAAPGRAEAPHPPAAIDPSVFASTMAGRIGQITVETANVFDPARPGEDWALFRIANRLHRVTRPAVIHRELLFASGDPYDPALLAETERNLRRLGFLRNAYVEPVPGPGGRIDVRVRTNDAWSLAPDVSWKRQGGRNDWRLGMSDSNLLGWGKQLSASGSHTDLGYQRAMAYTDQQVWGRHITLNTDAETRTDFNHYAVGLSRPFYASISTYTLGTNAMYQDQVVPFYDTNGQQTGKVRQINSDVGMDYGRAFGSTPHLIRQGTIGLHRTGNVYQTVPETVAALPVSTERNSVNLSARWEKVDFVKVRNIQQIMRDEDYNMGPSIVPSVSLAPRALGGAYNSATPSLAVIAGHAFTPERFVIGRTAYNVGYGQITPTTSAGFDVQYYDQPIHRHTFAAHVAYDRVVHSNGGGALLLGEDSGLRGYGLREFSGDRRFISNFEDRVLVAEDLFHLVSFGVAGFFDAGYAWANESMAINDLRPSAGVGLRFASSRATHATPLRIDFAYAFRDNAQRTRWTVSILAGQLFAPPQSQP